MRASSETYEKVAKMCSAYERVAENQISNSACDCKEKSCMNCKHFASDKYCKLDLYDQIVKEHQF